jgi:hypothetical protein
MTNGTAECEKFVTRHFGPLFVYGRKHLREEWVVLFLFAISLYLLPRADTTGYFLWVTALMALGNGLLVPTLTGMASRHVHGRAQGRVLGLNASAGALGRFLGPALAAIPLPAAFSDWDRPLAPDVLAIANHSYIVAFSASAGIMVVAFLIILAMKPLDFKTPGEDTGVATA